MSTAATSTANVSLMTGERSRVGKLPTGQHRSDQTSGGTSAMPDAGETFRLASGIFYRPPQLARAVSDLLAGGCTPSVMCLAGTREALGTIAQAASPRSARQLRPLYPLCDGVEVMATSGVLLRKLLKEAAWREGENSLPSSWLLPELFGRFTDHMRKNAIVLLVSAPDPGLQQHGSRILLRHSDHTVQTHEFSLVRPADL